VVLPPRLRIILPADAPRRCGSASTVLILSHSRVPNSLTSEETHRRVNVLIVVPWDQTRGGVATVVNNLAKHLVQNGHGVHFLHPGDAERPQPKTTRAGFPGYQLNLRGPVVARRPLVSATAFWLHLPATLLRLRKLLRRHRIKVVSIHYPLPSFLYFALCRLLFGVRVVVSAHGADLMPDGRCAPRYPWSTRLLLRACDRVTAPSRNYLESVLDAFPRLRHKAVPVHNGIDLTEFGGDHCDVGMAPREDFLLNIAAHNTKKGIDTLLQAMSIARSRRPDLKLVQVGDGPLRREMEALAERLGLEESVRFLGTQELPAVRRLLGQCAAFVLPSRSEPFGIVLLEAMACGKAVVASRVGGIPEFVVDGESGYLVPPDDPQALADAICRVVAEETARHRLGMAGKKAVVARFTHEHMGARFESIFRDLLAGGDGGPGDAPLSPFAPRRQGELPRPA
jgi:glycosyltransferase involved in cell wall biosynthesis